MARIGTAYIEISGDFSPLRRQLATMGRGSEFTVGVKAQVDRSSFSRAKAEGEALGGQEEIDLKAKVDLASFAKTRAAQALLTKESGRLADVFNRSSLSIGQMTTALVFASPVILDAAAALGALAGSLGAATAGFGALAVGAASAATVGFGGILAIAGPAISSLTDVMSAQEAANKAQVTGSKSSGLAAMASAQQIRSANEQVETSLRGVETAEEQLELAQESELLAQEALTQAREDATRQLQDMRRAAIEGETAEERARLTLTQANENLNRLLLSGTATALDLADADLSIVEARQNLRDVTIDSNRAQQDYNKANRGGINEMPGVVSAQQSLDSAVRGVEEAQQGVADAHRDVAKALQNLSYQQKQANQATVAGGTSMAALALAQKKAGPVVVEFAKRLKQLGRDWRGLTREGRDDFFRMLTDGVDRLNEKLPLLARSANRSMGALRDGFNDFLDRATGPEFDHFINAMTNVFAKSIGPVSRAFGNIAKVLQRIAVAVAPDIIRMARGFEEMTKGWVDSTRNAKSLRETVHGLVKQTEAWWDLLVAAKDLIVAVLVPGMGQGKRAVKGITDQLKEWTRWVDSHPKQMKEFFKEGLKTTKQLAQALLSFLPSLVEFAQAMRPLSRLFLAMLKGLNTIKVGNVSALTVLLGAFVASKFLGSITAFGQSLKLLSAGGLAGRIKKVTAAMAVSSAVGTGTAAGASTAAASAFPFAGMGGVPIKKAPSKAVGAFPFAGMGKSFQGTDEAAKLSTQLGKFAKVAGPAALAITAVAGAFLALKDNFLGVRDVFTGFFDRVLKPLGDAFSDLDDELTGGLLSKAISAIGDALSKIKGPAQWIVANVTKLLGLAALGAIFTGLGIAIALVVAPLWLAIKGLTLLIRGLKAIGGAVKDAAGFIKDHWGDIGRVLGAPFRFVWRVAKDALGFVRDKVGDLIGYIKDRWPAIKQVLFAPFRAIGGFVKDKVGFVIEKLGGVIDWVKDKWGKLGDILKKPFRAIGGFVSGIFNRIKDSIIGVVNDLISAFNKLPGPDIGLIGKEATIRTTRTDRGFTFGPRGLETRRGRRVARGQYGGFVGQGGIAWTGYQQGGMVGRRGLKPGPRDKIPALLEVGELVIPKKMVDQTKKNAKAIATDMGGEIGKGYKKVSEDSKDFVKRHGKSMETLRKTAGEQTDKFRKTTGRDFEKTGKDANERTKKMRGNVVEGFTKMRASSVDQSGKMKSGVGEDFRNLTGAVGDGLRKIAQMTNNALKALGVKRVNFNISTGGGGRDNRRQTGGMVVPGSGSGDTVPVQAMVEPGEVLAVLNRKAAKKWMAWNDEFPRRQQGGIVDRTGVPHFASGGFTGMQPEITKLTKLLLGRFGGSFSGTRPGDPGFHGRGLASDIVPADWAAASRYVNSIGPSLLEGIYNPGMFGGSAVSWDTGKRVSPSFWGSQWANHLDHIHIATESAVKGAIAMAKRLKKVTLEGPEGAPKDLGQAALDKTRKAADDFIASKQVMSTDILSGLQGSVVKVFAKVVRRLRAGPVPALALFEAGLAESGMRDLPGGDASSQGPLQLLASTAAGLGVSPHDISGVASLFLTRGFYGRGGAMSIHKQQPGLPASMIAQMVQGSAFSDGSNYAAQRSPALALMKQQGLSTKDLAGYAKGGMLAPFVGSFARGGEVKRDGLAMVHKGEKVLPKPSEGLTMHQVLRGLKRALNDDGKALRQFLDKFHRRLDRMDKSRLREFARKLDDWGGPAAKKLAALVRRELHDRPRTDKREEVVPMQQGGMLREPRRTRRDFRRERDRLRDDARDVIRNDNLGRKQQQKLIQAINAQIEASKELQAQTGELRRDIKEHNDLYKTLRAADKAGMQAVANFVSREVGAKGLQKTRNAGYGVDRRY